MRLTHHRRLVSQVIEIAIGIVDEPIAAEEIMRFKLAGRIVHILSCDAPPACSGVMIV
jgi:hypothetical protein